MKTYLDRILDQKKLEVNQLKKRFNYKDFENMPDFERSSESLKHRLKQSFGIIAEMKRKSPSAGSISPNLDVKKQGREYENAGVAGISCLTDNQFFGGSAQDLRTLRTVVSLPILRKDFIIDELQLFESKAIGADVVLLIAEALDKEQALYFTIIAQRLGLEVIMECHDSKQLHKINALVDIVGINNRDLRAQRTNLRTSFELIHQLPDNSICISESGIQTREELIQLRELGFHGALIGESILRQADAKQFIQSIQPMPYVN